MAKTKRTAARRAAEDRYARTPKGLERYRRYNESPKGMSRHYDYIESPKGVESACRKYIKQAKLRSEKNVKRTTQNV